MLGTESTGKLLRKMVMNFRVLQITENLSALQKELASVKLVYPAYPVAFYTYTCA
jgi:hypothetical protein